MKKVFQAKLKPLLCRLDYELNHRNTLVKVLLSSLRRIEPLLADRHMAGQRPQLFVAVLSPLLETFSFWYHKETG